MPWPGSAPIKRLFGQGPPQGREAGKKLKKYYKATEWERQQLEGTCTTFLTSLYFQNGKKLKERLLKGEPYKEWATQLMRCVRVEIGTMVDDKEALAHASADELVSGTPFGEFLVPD